MGQIIVKANDFSLTSKYECNVSCTYYYTLDGVLFDSVHDHLAFDADIVSNTVRFDYNIPGGAVVTSAKVYATLSSSKYGSRTNTINGIYADEGRTNQIGINLAEGSSSIDVRFVFQSYSVSHEHTSSSYGAEGDWVYNNDSEVCTREKIVQHEGRIDYTNVYLLIEYDGSGSGSSSTSTELINYTDPNPVIGETFAKAVHMTELQTNVNRIRTAHGLEDYPFTSIIALETSVNDWRKHVLQIRAAIDSIGVEHEEWIAFSGNYPRLNILLQLRRVVQTIAVG